VSLYRETAFLGAKTPIPPRQLPMYIAVGPVACRRFAIGLSRFVGRMRHYTGGMRTLRWSGPDRGRGLLPRGERSEREGPAIGRASGKRASRPRARPQRASTMRAPGGERSGTRGRPGIPPQAGRRGGSDFAFAPADEPFRCWLLGSRRPNRTRAWSRTTVTGGVGCVILRRLRALVIQPLCAVGMRY